MIIQFFITSSNLEMFESRLTVSSNDNVKSIKSNSIHKSWGNSGLHQDLAHGLVEITQNAREGTSLRSLISEKYKQ